MNITLELCCLAILLFIYFVLGILLGWTSKDRYPGNTTDEWTRGYNAGKRSVKRKGYKEGYEAGKKEILQKIEKMKLEK